MDREELLELAYAVRAEADAMYQEGKRGPAMGSDLGGACGDVSLAFVILAGLPEDCYRAGEYRSRSEYTWGEGHCWVQMPDGEIWDLTATQFGVPEKVYISKANDRYRCDKGGDWAIRELDTWGAPKWRESLIERVRAARTTSKVAA